MSRFSDAINAARHRLWSAEAWVWLAEIGSASGGFYRLCKGRDAVQAGGFTWQPGLQDVRVPADDAEGALGEAQLVVPNVSRLPFALADAGDLDAEPVRLIIAHESALAKLETALEWSLRVLRTDADARTLTIDAGHAAEVSLVPSRVYTRAEYPGLLPGGGLRR